MTKKQEALLTEIEAVSVSPTVHDAGAGASFDRGAQMMKEAIVESLRRTEPAPKAEPEPEPEPEHKVRKHRKITEE